MPWRERERDRDRDREAWEISQAKESKAIIPWHNLKNFKKS